MNVIRFRRYVVIPLLLLVAVSISGQSTEQKDEFDPEIVEAVFRYQISKCAENMTLSVFLLSVHGADPSDEFMKRFANEVVTVRKGSARGKSSTNEFTDRESGRFAALLSFDKLKLIEADEVQVDGSCGYADWAARGYRYTLIKEKNRWIVKRAVSTWFL